MFSPFSRLVCSLLSSWWPPSRGHDRGTGPERRHGLQRRGILPIACTQGAHWVSHPLSSYKYCLGVRTIDETRRAEDKRKSREECESGIFRIRSPWNWGLGLVQEDMLGS